MRQAVAFDALAYVPREHDEQVVAPARLHEYVPFAHETQALPFATLLVPCGHMSHDVEFDCDA